MSKMATKLTVYAFLAAEGTDADYAGLDSPGEVVESKAYAYDNPVEATKTFERIKRAIENSESN